MRRLTVCLTRRRRRRRSYGARCGSSRDQDRASAQEAGNGGLFITNKKYGDFEVVVDMRNDFVITWINGVQFLDWTDTMPRASEGYLALQLHHGLEFVHGKNWVGVDGSTGGEMDYTKRFIRYRNVRLKELTRLVPMEGHR